MSTENVIAQVIGGSKQVLDGVETVADVKAKLDAGSHVAQINGQPAADDAQVRSGDFITLAKAAKGGL